MRFLITGDLVVSQDYSAINNIDRKLIDLFSQSDFNIVNLEAPITNYNNKIIKTGPHLKANRESTLEVLKVLNINIAALANNHIKDYDEQGVLDTISFCEGNAIKTIGAGANSISASQTMVINTPEGKVALINIAENEWASADDDTAGANGMNLIKDTRKIQQAKKENDFVFVIVHGGHEYYNLPSPRIQEQYRFYAEQGADLVVGHHTHCISGYEIYNGTPIYYSLGNFLFTMSSTYDDWYTGVVLEVEISAGKIKTTLHPIEQERAEFKLSLLEDNERNRTISRIEKYSLIIENKDALTVQWGFLIRSRQMQYLNYWSPMAFIRNKYISALLNRLKISLINVRGLSLYLNLMQCEAHRDLSKAAIKEHLKK